MRLDRTRRFPIREKAGSQKTILFISRMSISAMERPRYSLFFHPATGQVRVKGVTQSTNAILHPWVKEQIREILEALPEKPLLDEATNHQMWTAWQAGLSKRITLAEKLPPLRMLLIWDNLQGHHTPEMVLWLFEHGVMPLLTPLGGSWLNMAKSIQRILIRRGLSWQNPEIPEQIMA